MKILNLITTLLLLLGISLPKYKTTKAFNKDIIDLNNCTEEEIKNYYGNLNNKSGTKLKDYLYDIISKDNTFISYEKVSDWYKITDRNYDISNEINPNEYNFQLDNISTYYTYNMYISKESNNDINKAISNAVNSGKVNKEINKVTYTIEDNKYVISKPNGYIQVDKEHVWPKNRGFKVIENNKDIFSLGAPTDLHNLVAADHNTNSTGHNDYLYGEVKNKDGNEVYAYLADNTKEVSGWKEKNENGETIFEPTDEWKGNIARCLFYMATRYGKKHDTNTQSEPYLELTDSSETNSDNEIFHGVHNNLSMLLSWHNLDPVDEYEIKRNNLIYKNVQNNRNPYIDYPSLANKVFSTNYDFSKLKNNYNLHLHDEINLDISLPKSNSNNELKNIEYDKNIISLIDNKIKAINIGETNLKYIIQDNENNIISFETKIIVKDIIKHNIPNIINLKSYEQRELILNIENLFEDEKVIIEIDNNNIKYENNIINASIYGKDKINIYIEKDNEKTFLTNIEIVISLSPLIISLIIGLSLLLIAVIILIIIFSNKKKLLQIILKKKKEKKHQ